MSPFSRKKVYGDEVEHIEETAHGRVERYIREQLAEVAKSAAIEQLLIAPHPARQSDIDGGHHQDLAQGERHALPQLVLPV